MNAAQADNTAFAVALLIAAVVAIFLFLIVMVLFAALFGSWLRGYLSGVPVSVVQILGMRLRGTPPRLIVDSLITLVHRGHPYDRMMGYHAESLYLAQRGLIRSPEHLADLVEKSLQAEKRG